MHNLDWKKKNPPLPSPKSEEASGSGTGEVDGGDPRAAEANAGLAPHLRHCG